MRLDQQQILRWFAGATAGFVLLALPWPALGTAFAAGYARVVDALLFDHLTFGQGGHARLRRLASGEGEGTQNVTPDAVLSLRVDGYTGDLPMTMSLRRDAYLPIVLLLAVVGAAPLSWRRRLRALALGLPAIVALTVACQWFGILWLFGARLHTVLDWTPTFAALINGLYQALLLPPANRFAVPLLLGIGLVWWQRRAQSRAHVAS